MWGIIFNLLLAAFAVASLLLPIMFAVSVDGMKKTRVFMLALGIDTFFLCLGYALLAFSPDLSLAYIPRLVGFVAIEFFFLIELVYLLFEVGFSAKTKSLIIAFFSIYILVDLAIHGRASVFRYVRYDNLFTGYYIVNASSQLFHYTYIFAISFVLVALAFRWRSMQKTKHDKKFCSEIIFANLLAFIDGIPSIFLGQSFKKYQTFFYCSGFALIFFLWIRSVWKKAAFSPTVKNTAEGIFSMIDVPIVIFDLHANILLFNPAAKSKIACLAENMPLRDALALTDVEQMRMLVKSKRGEKYFVDTKLKSSGTPCTLTTCVKTDAQGELFCIIGALSRR